MSRFIQLHILTQYPPSNLNRDDTGRPKTALVGDALRLRISSQSLKRAWRTSEVFGEALGASAYPAGEPVVRWGKVSTVLGTRTKEAGIRVYEALVERGVSEKDAHAWAQKIAERFGKRKKESKENPQNDLEIEQLAHVSPGERDAIDALVKSCAGRGSAPSDDELKLLRRPQHAVDIAMFGRMLADEPSHNMDAAVQVAHAFTVHKSAVEDDYFSAVDDLNEGLEDKGAGHIGERGYGAGVFYLYLCINRELLAENLDGDDALTEKALQALLHAVTKISPTGMQNSYASRAYASYVMAECGDQQPRSLSQAFLKPVRGNEEKGTFDLAVQALETRRDNFDKVYGSCAEEHRVMNVERGEGSLQELVDFVARC
ncbi:type I-E CRISPR-associated protein Cas7/Cse4/CasC [Algiphilus aromaticivorans]|uniref:type I-E CRISPR-associated protein Cas7/Cse4/CasC n=1 Tax=Algiphilus aromaticivorans TaxID=382454 RepID=UPI0005C20B3C|nr:type I-E CRISPR-associated protein Cas7/Cse4/CasC [Algiphilus aromaticivorans]